MTEWRGGRSGRGGDGEDVTGAEEAEGVTAERRWTRRERGRATRGRERGEMRGWGEVGRGCGHRCERILNWIEVKFWIWTLNKVTSFKCGPLLLLLVTCILHIRYK